jgi:hypothetical protein
MPKRAMRHTDPISHGCSPGALGRHVGRRATTIMFQPQVKSQSTHSEMTKRTAMYDVLLIADLSFR